MQTVALLAELEILGTGSVVAFCESREPMKLDKATSRSLVSVALPPFFVDAFRDMLNFDSDHDCSYASSVSFFEIGKAHSAA